MKYITISLLFLFIIIQSCALDEPSITKTETNLNNKVLSPYVAIGNSVTAGYQSSSLVEKHQRNSFPNLISRQIGNGELEHPWVSYPGIPNILELKSLTGVLAPAPGTGIPTNTTLARPYDNLGIPGIVLADVQVATASDNSYSGSAAIDLILRNPAMGNTTVYQQAQMLQPNFITCWIGNNDVLGFATSGGVQPSSPTNSQVFANLYGSLAAGLDTLAEYVVVSTIPDVTSLPFFTTVGPRVAAGIPAGGVLRYQEHGQPISPTHSGTSTAEDLFTYKHFITLLAGQYAAEIGKPSGLWYRDLAADMGIPVSALIAGIQHLDTTQAFGFYPQNPIPDALILDESEIETAQTSISEFNTAITNLADQYGFALVDIYTIFNNIAQNGYHEQNVHLSAAFITGGLFSRDGVHPSDAGHGVIANEFIKAMNAEFDLDIAPVILYPLQAQTAADQETKAEPLHNIQSLKSTVEVLGGKLW
ncbi:MAG: SGNH/GDSL hydrolase family protein [Calditrichaceae bacterium]|nr:SGNH/GDSL hydrolase family protein [Calditrichaceae bacterium]MBN2708280.1 SGNH/GDSL hydrolase family protein [Calditrichaceae bacterium]RQV91922.1 MAG: hypothetical protein EH224_16975 [Calditrichota bacterium]